MKWLESCPVLLHNILGKKKKNAQAVNRPLFRLSANIYYHVVLYNSYGFFNSLHPFQFVENWILKCQYLKPYKLKFAKKTFYNIKAITII